MALMMLFDCGISHSAEEREKMVPRAQGLLGVQNVGAVCTVLLSYTAVIRGRHATPWGGAMRDET